MPSTYLSRANVRFHAIAPGSIYETMVQAIVDQNSYALFPDFYCRRIEPYFQTAAGDVQPDLVLVGRTLKRWGLVEVEAEEHSVRGHVKPQLTKLTYARAEGRALTAIRDAFADLDPVHLERSLQGPPLVFLVTHGETRLTRADLESLGVTRIDLALYAGPANDYIVQARDYSHSLVPLGAPFQRIETPLVRGVWRAHPDAALATLLPSSGSSGRVLVDLDGVRAHWTFQTTSDGFLFRMPTDLASYSCGQEADASVDLQNGIIVLTSSQGDRKCD